MPMLQVSIKNKTEGTKKQGTITITGNAKCHCVGEFVEGTRQASLAMVEDMRTDRNAVRYVKCT